MIKNKCFCGTGAPTPHEVTTGGCQRVLCDAPIPDGNCWLVNGVRITDTTLRQQRGYHKHESGSWSRFSESTNSLEGDW